MRIRHTITVVPPFEVNPADGTQIIDAEGSVIATTTHLFLSEMIVSYLNEGEMVPFELEEEVAA